VPHKKRNGSLAGQEGDGHADLSCCTARHLRRGKRRKGFGEKKKEKDLKERLFHRSDGRKLPWRQPLLARKHKKRRENRKAKQIESFKERENLRARSLGLFTRPANATEGWKGELQAGKGWGGLANLKYENP